MRVQIPRGRYFGFDGRLLVFQGHVLQDRVLQHHGALHDASDGRELLVRPAPVKSPGQVIFTGHVTADGHHTAASLAQPSHEGARLVRVASTSREQNQVGGPVVSESVRDRSAETADTSHDKVRCVWPQLWGRRLRQHLDLFVGSDR